MDAFTTSMNQLKITSYNHDPFLWEEPVQESEVGEIETENESCEKTCSETDSNKKIKSNTYESAVNIARSDHGEKTTRFTAELETDDDNVVGVTTSES